MQPLDVLSSYVRRRGYFDLKLSDTDCKIGENSFENILFEPKFVSRIARFRFNNSFHIVEELENYIKFITNLLSFDERASLISLNQRIIDSIELKELAIPQKIICDFRKIAFEGKFVSPQFSPLVAENVLIKKLTYYVNNGEFHFLAEIIRNFIDIDDHDQSINSDIDEDDKKCQIGYDNLPSKSMDISPEWLKINELKVELSTRNEEISDSLDILYYYRLYNQKNHTLSIDISDDRRYFACGVENGEIIIKYLNKYSTNKEEINIKYNSHHLKYENSSVFCLKILNKSQDYFLCGSENGSVRLVRTIDAVGPAVNYYGHRYPVFCLDIEPEDQFFATASFDQTARLFNFEDNRPFRILAGHSDAVQCVAFVHGVASGSRPLVATASSDKSVRLWSQDQALPVRVYNCCSSLISSCSTKNLLACGSSAEGKIHFYDLRHDKSVQILDSQDFLPSSLDFDDQGRIFVSGSNGRLKIFEWDSVLCKYNESSSRAFAVPGDGIVYCFKIPNYSNPYLTCVSADLYV